jgi:hypothetical protein
MIQRFGPTKVGSAEILEEAHVFVFRERQCCSPHLQRRGFSAGPALTSGHESSPAARILPHMTKIPASEEAGYSNRLRF